MKASKTKLPIVELIGDPFENFYSLGLKDAESFPQLHKHLLALISTPWPKLNSLTQSFMAQVVGTMTKRHDFFQKSIAAYSEGLKRPFSDVAFLYLIPEFMSALSRWSLPLPRSLWGCSSFFTLLESENIHGRILDFPLMTSYDLFERSTLSRFKGAPQVFSYGCSGLPFSGLTAMNDQGVTLALHQKFTDTFDPLGTPVFELAHRFMHEVYDVQSAKKFLKKAQTMTTWCFATSFSSGEILLADLASKKSSIKEHQLRPGEIFYINNKLIDTKKKQDRFLPWGMSTYNEQRELIALKKIEKLKKKKNLSEKELIVEMGKPLTQSSKGPYQLDPLTPSSLVVTTLNPKKGHSFYLPGSAPKVLQEELLDLSSLWKSSQQQILKLKSSQELIDYKTAVSDLMLAQVSFDKKDFSLAYHHIQMAIESFKEHPLKNIALFYFFVFQYIHEPHQKVRIELLRQFSLLKEQLNPYLKEHCHLFIYRLERILQYPQTISKKDFTHPQLKKVFLFEEKIPDLILHKTTATFMHPRLDLLDIIYPHVLFS